MLKTPKKKPKSGRPKLRSIKAIRREIDMLWSAYIKRERTCFFADAGLGECKGNLEAAHLIARSQSARIMYHPENGVPACTWHHGAFDNKHQGTIHRTAINYVHEQLPGRYELLEDLARKKEPIKRYEWEETLAQLRSLK